MPYTSRLFTITFSVSTLCVVQSGQPPVLAVCDRRADIHGSDLTALLTLAPSLRKEAAIQVGERIVGNNLQHEAPAVGTNATGGSRLPLSTSKVRSAGLVNPIQISPLRSLTAYLVSACLIAGAIVLVYWSKGVSVICRIILYLLANSTMKISVKLIFVDYGFNFPKFITAIHFVTSAVAAFYVLLHRDRSVDAHNVSIRQVGRQLAVPTGKEFWSMIVPMACAFALSVGTNNMALVFCSASFTEIISACSPLVTILLILLMGMPFDTRMFWPTLLVMVGCILSVSGELHFSIVGFAFVIISVVGRSLKTTLQQRMMTDESKDKFDPIALLAWMCIPSAVVMIAYSLCVEGLSPLVVLAASTRRHGLVLSILISCINACILNMSNIFCVKDLGAVGVQLVAQLKSVLTVLGAVALFHEEVTPLQVCGFVGVLAGVYWFSSVGKDKDKG